MLDLESNNILCFKNLLMEVLIDDTGVSKCAEKSIAGLRLLFLEKHVCKVGPWLVLKTLRFRRVPTISYLRRVAHCA